MPRASQKGPVRVITYPRTRPPSTVQRPPRTGPPRVPCRVFSAPVPCTRARKQPHRTAHRAGRPTYGRARVRHAGYRIPSSCGPAGLPTPLHARPVRPAPGARCGSGNRWPPRRHGQPSPVCRARGSLRYPPCRWPRTAPAARQPGTGAPGSRRQRRSHPAYRSASACSLSVLLLLLQHPFVLGDHPVDLASLETAGDQVGYLSGPHSGLDPDAHLERCGQHLLAGRLLTPRGFGVVPVTGLGDADTVQLEDGLLHTHRQIIGRRGCHRLSVEDSPLVPRAFDKPPDDEVGVVSGRHEPVPLGCTHPVRTVGLLGVVVDLHIPPPGDLQQLLVRREGRSRGLVRDLLLFDLRSVFVPVLCLVLRLVLLYAQVHDRCQLVPAGDPGHVQDQGVGLAGLRTGTQHTARHLAVTYDGNLAVPSRDDGSCVSFDAPHTLTCLMRYLLEVLSVKLTSTSDRLEHRVLDVQFIKRLGVVTVLGHVALEPTTHTQGLNAVCHQLVTGADVVALTCPVWSLGLPAVTQPQSMKEYSKLPLGHVLQGRCKVLGQVVLQAAPSTQMLILSAWRTLTHGVVQARGAAAELGILFSPVHPVLESAPLQHGHDVRVPGLMLSLGNRDGVRLLVDSPVRHEPSDEAQLIICQRDTWRLLDSCDREDIARTALGQCACFRNTPLTVRCSWLPHHPMLVTNPNTGSW